METIEINGLKISVDDRASSYDIYQKPSSNVEFFGINRTQDKLLIQFKNGNTYIFSGLPVDLVKEAPRAESIGKFFSSQVSGKFSSEKITERLIIPVSNESINA